MISIVGLLGAFLYDSKEFASPPNRPFSPHWHDIASRHRPRLCLRRLAVVTGEYDQP